MEAVKIALLGVGTVGGGVYKVLQQNSREIEMKVGARLEVVKVLERNLERTKELGIPDEIVTTDFSEITGDPEINIVVELVGGVEAARSFVKASLEAGKSVATANKDLIALYGQELFEAAHEHKVDLLFEASVGGGIPIIRPLKESLAANKIEQIIGIVNGTTNYMLTKMAQEGSDFAEVLAEAQAKGYAEADPTSDVEGYDAARKLAILASIGFNSRVTFPDVHVEGITKISKEDMAYAKELGYVVKLLAIAKESDGSIEARVHPAFLPTNHPLASVNDVFNAIFVRGDAVGDTMFYGRGAGELPTASAVAGDIMEAARNILHRDRGRHGCTCYDQKPIKDIGDTRSKYFVRLVVLDKPGVLASIASVFGNQDVSLNSVIQKRKIGEMAELVFVTHEVLDRNIQDSLAIIKAMPTVESVANLIRVEGDEF
ncbi:MAG: homoserine dehydrogenase [Clostridia bacterium]|nr:homoserine dehydrogenase [Clostridia bacterium]